MSSATWVSPTAIVLAISPTSVSSTPLPSRVVRFDQSSREMRSLFWATDLFPFRGSLNPTAQFGVLDDHSLVFDSFEYTQPLYTVSTTARGEPREKLSGGISVDRQPAYHPDGDRVLFMSNRSGNVDLYAYELATGDMIQLTDHPSSDWDGGYTPDGKSILWGSDRTGNLEIWIADTDGANPRQITRSGAAAENPTMTPDGEWVVYSNSHPDRPGIYRVRSDGTDDELLVQGNWVQPEVSPDGRFALYVGSDNARLVNAVRVVELDTREVTPFEVQIPFELRSPNVTYGRGRWMPGGNAIVFVDIDAEGRTGLSVQDFDPEKNLPDSRRALVGFGGDVVFESFGISPDGERVTFSSIEQTSAIHKVDGLANLRE